MCGYDQPSQVVWYAAYSTLQQSGVGTAAVRAVPEAWQGDVRGAEVLFNVYFLFKPLYDKFYSVGDPLELCLGLDFERWQRVTMKEHLFSSWHKLDLFVKPPLEGGIFYQAVQDLWCEYNNARALALPTPVVFSYMTNMVQTETRIERVLTLKVAKVKYDATCLVSFFQFSQYARIERLAYPQMVSGCSGGGALLYYFV